MEKMTDTSAKIACEEVLKRIVKFNHDSSYKIHSSELNRSCKVYIIKTQFVVNPTPSIHEQYELLKKILHLLENE